MRTSRRYVIRLGLGAAAQTGAAAEDEGAWLRRDLFEACAGELFVVRTRSQRVALRLRRVEDVLSARNAGTVAHQDCFTVVFRGSRWPYLAQGTYQVENSTLGKFSMFLVPGALTTSGITYAATFNRVGAV
jgi:hypothetical protein